MIENQIVSNRAYRPKKKFVGSLLKGRICENFGYERIDVISDLPTLDQLSKKQGKYLIERTKLLIIKVLEGRLSKNDAIMELMDLVCIKSIDAKEFYESVATKYSKGIIKKLDK